MYFWLLPAYVLWYTVLPSVAGGRLFSDRLARMVFILFVLLSTPVGFHHQFEDPGISAGWKFAHTLTTYAILYPSFVTAFTVIASLEVAGRMKGATGLFNWIGRLPWKDPFFASVALAMLGFTFGGFGGAINAAYAMNAMVHNTAWIQGHFHVTLGTTVALTFMGATYYLLPRLLGRDLRLMGLARVQPWLWALGMALFSTSYHIAGLRGLPRRVYSAALNGEYGAQWHTLTVVAAVGGTILFLSALSFVVVVVVHVDRRQVDSGAGDGVRRAAEARDRQRLGSIRAVDGAGDHPGGAGLRVSADHAVPAPAVRLAGVQAVLTRFQWGGA